MVVSLEYELSSFLMSILLALGMGLIYDLFRAIRAFGKRILFWDIIMWISLFTAFFCGWYILLDSQVRWYMILGAFFSGIIYFFSMSKYVFFLLHFFVGKICRIFRIIIKILLTPLRFLCKIIGVYVYKAKSEISKKVEEKNMKKKPKIKMNIMTFSITVAALISVGMVVKGAMYQPTIAANEKRAEEIKESIAYEEQRIKEIDEVTEKVGTDEYIEKVAREKLGMIKSDEIVFVDISGQ